MQQTNKEKRISPLNYCRCINCAYNYAQFEEIDKEERCTVCGEIFCSDYGYYNIITSIMHNINCKACNLVGQDEEIQIDVKLKIINQCLDQDNPIDPVKKLIYKMKDNI